VEQAERVGDGREEGAVEWVDREEEELEASERELESEETRVELACERKEDVSTSLSMKKGGPGKTYLKVLLSLLDCLHAAHRLLLLLFHHRFNAQASEEDVGRV
jgi:hypothetical protein